MTSGTRSCLGRPSSLSATLRRRGSTIRLRPSSRRTRRAWLPQRISSNCWPQRASARIASPSSSELRRHASVTEPAVLVHASDRVEPPSESAEGPVLIHISDLHFAGRAELGTPEAVHRFHDAEDSRPLVEELLDELRGPYAHFRYQPERLHIAVTGDLTWRGNAEEFGQTLDFLTSLCSGLGIPHSRVHVIPGNHDIDWPMARSDPQRRLDNYLRFLIELYGEQDVAERYPFIRWPLGFGSEPPEAYQILSIALEERHRLLVCGLNSCVFENEQHHFGYVGQRQLRQLQRRLIDLDPAAGVLRVALIHHHLHPFPEYLVTRNADQVWLDLSTVRDAGVLERELEQLGFDLVLHGHKHKPQTRETRVRQVGPLKREHPPLVVCGAGSAGSTELAHADANQYEVIEITRIPREKNVEFARLEWRVLPLEAGAVWQTQQSWSIGG